MHVLGAWPRRGQTPAVQGGGSRGLAGGGAERGWVGLVGTGFLLALNFFMMVNYT